MKHLCLLIGTAFTFTAHAKLLFEGYYRIERGSTHYGYLVQRDELNEKTKERKITYFGIRSEKGNLSYDGTQVVAHEGTSNLFEPVRYTHMVSGANKGPPLIEEGSVTAKKLNITVSDYSEAARNDSKKQVSQPAKLVAKFKLDVRPEQFFSTFIPAYAVADAGGNLKQGAEYSYDVFLEETRVWVPGDLKVLRIINTADGKRVFHMLQRAGSNQTEYFTYSDGQVLGYRMDDVIVYLTRNREEAIGELPFLKDPIQKLFGDLPFGLENPVSKALGKADAKSTINIAPALTDKERKYTLSASAKTLGKKAVSK